LQLLKRHYAEVAWRSGMLSDNLTKGLVIHYS